MAIDWDLSSSHTVRDVDAPEDADLRLYDITPVKSVAISLPQDRMFAANEDVRRVFVERDGDTVALIQVDYELQEADEAYDRAVALVAEWDLRRDRLDEWLAAVRSARAAGRSESDVGSALATTAQVNAPFEVSVEIRYSLDDNKPWIVSFNMFWNSGG